MKRRKLEDNYPERTAKVKERLRKLDATARAATWFEPQQEPPLLPSGLLGFEPNSSALSAAGHGDSDRWGNALTELFHEQHNRLRLRRSFGEGS